MKKQSILILVALCTVAAAVGQPAYAADALAICNSGQPFVYPGGGANILWNPDQGGLGVLTNPQAIAAVDAAFDQWENLPQSSASYFQGPTLAVDIDSTNFGPIANPVAPNGESEIVFDEDGSIFDILFGPGSGILGFAGPDFGDTLTCELLEGSAFLNGPAFLDALEAEDIMVHEFGHYTNLGHVELNGQLVAFSEGGDDTGASPDNTTFPPPPTFLNVEIVETMYPFYFGNSAVGTRTPHADDIASLATLYPEVDFLATTGSILGTIRTPNGTPISGVNVIARNLADPFVDSVSTFSGAYTNSTDPADPNVGVYTLANLTPGATYAVFVDVVTAAAGRFSNPIIQPLPGPEDYYNGASESSDGSIDDPSVIEGVASVAGTPATGVDIVFNAPLPGDPLAVGDDGAVQLFMPFNFCIHGQSFDSVNVNANGNLTFGAADPDFSESAAEFRDGPPRIAALWDDLNPSAGGVVTFDQTPSSFTVSWEEVPEWLATGSNTFSITLNDNSSACVDDADSDSDSDSDSDRHGRRGGADVVIEYTNIEAADGLAGVTGGLAVTNGIEPEVDLTAISRNGRKKIKVDKQAAVYELFSDLDNDLNGLTLEFNKVGKAFKDKFEPNNSLDTAEGVDLPFDTLDTRRAYSAIDPPAGDIDFFEFDLEEGTNLVAEVTRGQIDSVLGLWFCPSVGSDDDSDSDSDSDAGICDPSTALFLGSNDDTGGTLLSGFVFPVPVSGTYAIATTFCCDFDFDGVDPGQGAPLDGGRYILSLQALDGTLLFPGDDGSVEVPFGFSFPFQGGSYTSVYVNGNGFLTFGAPDTNFLNFIESVADLVGGPPRVAGLWDDLQSDAGGFVLAKEEASSLKVSFLDVPEWGTSNENTFAITLNADGSVEVDYGDLAAADGLAGVSEGGGAADPGEVDLSSSASWPVTGTTYELFDGFDNDLANSSLGFQDP